jgi:hypothetical protein
LGLRQQQEQRAIVDSGDAKWLLSRKGKARGYADKLEQEHSGKVDVEDVTDWKQIAEQNRQQWQELGNDE